MRVTQRTITKISAALAKKNRDSDESWNQTTLSEAMDRDRSWASRLLNGKKPTLSEEEVDKLCDILDIDLWGTRSKGGPGSSGRSILELTADDDPDLAGVLQSLETFVTRPFEPHIPLVEPR